jgi:hypothetical protein
MSSKYSINLLMLVEREGYSNFRLLISSYALKSDLATVSMVSKEISKMLTNDELKVLAGVDIVEHNSDLFIEVQSYLENNGNPIEFYNIEFGGFKINRALVIISPVEHSRKYVREAELIDLEKRLQDDVRLQLQLVLMQLKQLLAREYVILDELKQRRTGKDNFFTPSSEKQNLLPFSPQALQDKRKTIFKKDSING